MAAHQVPLSLQFSRQEYWSGLSFLFPMHACMLSHFICVQLYVTLWTAAHQTPLYTGLSRQEYWSGLLFPPPVDLSDPEIEPASPVSSALHQLNHQRRPKRFTSIYVRLCLCFPLRVSWYTVLHLAL